MVAFLLAVRPVAAQPTEYQGLGGSVMLGGTDYTLAGQSFPTRLAGGLSAGYRIHLWRVAGAPVYLTPHVSLVMTNVQGISLASSEVAFSQVNAGMQLTTRIWRVRPYYLHQGGKATIERYVGNALVNYYGNAPTRGIGIEIPFDNPCSAGLDLQLRRTRGNFSKGEWREAGAPPPGGSFRATTVTLGWSGRFRGGRLLFACR